MIRNPFRKDRSKLENYPVGFRGGKEFALSREEILGHCLVFGSEASEKRNIFLQMLSTTVRSGGGALFIDTSGTLETQKKIAQMCAAADRIDDLRILDFMTGNRDVDKSGGKLPTNTYNPFASGDSDQLTDIVVSMMDEAGGDGAMWRGRAQAMLTGVMRALVWLRNEGVVDLHVGTIRDFLGLRAIIDLGDPKKYPDMPRNIRASVRSYLGSLPGYVEEKGHKQGQTTLDQHGYLEMQFTRILGSLADVYGHIFFTEAAEVDMHDVVLNRRILVVTLPVLGKAANDVANLGRIVLGDIKLVLNSIPSKSSSAPPFLAILEDIPYYTINGLGLALSSASARNMALVAGATSPTLFERHSRMEALAMAEFVWNRIYLRMNSPESVRHILDLPVQARIKRRLIDMRRGYAVLVNGSVVHELSIPSEPEISRTFDIEQLTPAHTYPVSEYRPRQGGSNVVADHHHLADDLHELSCDPVGQKVSEAFPGPVEPHGLAERLRILDHIRVNKTHRMDLRWISRLDPVLWSAIDGLLPARATLPGLLLLTLLRRGDLHPTKDDVDAAARDCIATIVDKTDLEEADRPTTADRLILESEDWEIPA